MLIYAILFFHYDIICKHGFGLRIIYPQHCCFFSAFDFSALKIESMGMTQDPIDGGTVPWYHFLGHILGGYSLKF